MRDERWKNNERGHHQWTHRISSQEQATIYSCALERPAYSTVDILEGRWRIK